MSDVGICLIVPVSIEEIEEEQGSSCRKRYNNLFLNSITSTKGKKMKNFCVLLVASSIIFLGIAEFSFAGTWLQIPIINSGAEFGDTTGWFGTYEGPPPLEAYYDPNNAPEGEWFFDADLDFSRNPKGAYWLRQTVNLSKYTGKIQNINFWAMSSYDKSQIYGDSPYYGENALLTWEASLAVLLYDSQNNFLGFLVSIPELEPTSTDEWHWMGAQSYHSYDFENVKDNIDHMEVRLELGLRNTYSATNLGQWLDGEPQFGRFDSAEIYIETVPIPTTVSLVGVGVICLMVIRRKFNI